MPPGRRTRDADLAFVEASQAGLNAAGAVVEAASTRQEFAPVAACGRVPPTDEGVVKFRATLEQAPPPPRSLVAPLQGWRRILRALDLVGQSPDRYGGAGFGNLSRRVGDDARFVITGTQTGNVPELGPEHYVTVESFDLDKNSVVARGPIAASSESMTHGAVYDALPQVRFVFHAHAPDIWRNAQALDLPITSKDVAYGTPEMAREVARILADPENVSARGFSMGGHEDGIITFGATAQGAGGRMVGLLAAAVELREVLEDA